MNRSWQGTASLSETLSTLEGGLLPLFAIESFVFTLRRCKGEPSYALRTCAYVYKSGLDFHVPIANRLVSLLVDVGDFQDAQRIFDCLPYHDEESSSSLIVGYFKRGFSHQTLIFYQNLRRTYSDLPLSSQAFVCLLQLCKKSKNLNQGSEIHAHIACIGGLRRDVYVGSALIDMYAQCGSLPKAQKVFDELLDKNVITWTALIAGYVEDGQEDRAFKCFEQMQSTGLLPNAVTYVCILKACANVKHESKGRDIHVEIERQGFLDDNLFVASALVDMYAKCGSMKKAEQVFDKVAAQDIVLWTTLISGYTENGYAEAALACFEEMQCKGFSPNARTFACILKACGILGNMDRVSEIQVEAEKKGFLKKDIFLGSVLVDIYAKHGLLEKAKEVFDSLTTRDTILWTTLISGYTEHEQGKEALECFDQMQLEGIVPDALTFNCALKACGMTRARDKVQEIHRMIKGQKLLDKLTSVGNALIDAYVKCGCLSQAQQVFKELPSRNVLSWNLLIMGYVELQCHEEAIACFQSMKSKGVTPDTLTYVSILKASSSMEDIEMCEKILAEAEDGGLSKEDLFISSTIVDLYAKCGFLLRAQEAFDKAHVRDVVLWNALIAGFAQEGRGHEALDFLDQMLLEGVPPNAVTLLSGVKACGRIGAAKKGQELHTEIERRGLLDAEHVGNTLIDMYAKCGLLSKAQQVFNKVQNKDVISWTTLMTGYTQCGDVEIVFQIFDTMLGEGIKPNPVTFVVVLSACNHKGMYDKNETYIDAMNRAQGVVPELVYHNYETDPLIYSGKEVNTVNLFRRHRVCSMNVMSHAFLEL